MIQFNNHIPVLLIRHQIPFKLPTLLHLTQHLLWMFLCIPQLYLINLILMHTTQWKPPTLLGVNYRIWQVLLLLLHIVVDVSCCCGLQQLLCVSDKVHGVWWDDEVDSLFYSIYSVTLVNWLVYILKLPTVWCGWYIHCV